MRASSCALLAALAIACGPSPTGPDTTGEERAAPASVDGGPARTPSASPGAQLVADVLPRFRVAGQGPRPPLSAGLRQAQQLFAGARYEEAERQAAALVDTDSNPGYARYLLAASMQQRKHYAEARPHFEAVLRGGPSFFKAYNAFNLFGWCLFHLGDAAGARAAFEAHREFEPRYDDTHQGLGQVALEQGRFDDAEASFREAARLAPSPREAAVAHAYLADVYTARDDPRGARAELERALELQPDLPEAHFKLSRVLARLGDAEGAARHRERHLELRRATHGR